MDVASDKSGDWMTMVLPMFWSVSLRNRSERGRSNEHVRVEDDTGHWYHSNHKVVVEHILEFVPLPSVKFKLFRLCDCIKHKNL